MLSRDVGSTKTRKMGHLVGTPRKSSAFEFNPRRIDDESAKFHREHVENHRKISRIIVNDDLGNKVEQQQPPQTTTLDRQITTVAENEERDAAVSELVNCILLS